jgi:pyridoxal phosphate enzyme (YggS family)
VTLIAITKTFPASDAAILRDLGVLDLGENRDQDARRKAAEVPEARWHFVGQLQTNKARSVVGYASVVHSVDRAGLAEALAAALARAERESLDVLVQVNLDEAAPADAARGGAAPGQVPALADRVAELAGLRLRGVMAVAPLGAEPDRAFARLAQLAEQVRVVHPQATWVSAGMSGDLAAAIRHGSTHVRVGSALLGRRSAAFG